MSNRAMIQYEERAGDEVHETLGQPFLVKVQVKNNRLVKAREALGFESAKAACDATGLNYMTVIAFEGFRIKPTGKNGWRRIAIDIAMAYGVEPEDLWPECINIVQQAKFSMEAGVKDVLMLSSADPGARIDLVEMSKVTDEALQLLSPREQKVLRARFGIGAEERSLEELGDDLDLSRERVRQIELKALRKLAADSTIKMIK